jgi:hypothetical protein
MNRMTSLSGPYNYVGSYTPPTSTSTGNTVGQYYFVQAFGTMGDAMGPPSNIVQVT